MKRKTGLFIATIVGRPRSFNLKADPIDAVVVFPPPRHLGGAALTDRSRIHVERADLRGEWR